MSQVIVTIDNIEVKVRPGTTILAAAKEAGIDIPTLCNHRALSPTGACRVCVVEVEGQRTLQAACVFPVAEGMKIKTDSDRVVKARKLVLDMIFAERNHFCPFCEASGDCELQNLGYRYGIDHWAYETYSKPYPLDATREFFLMDHNRCILCGRCIRACDELVGNHTLGLQQRGTRSMVGADTNTPFGESTCVSCGTCLQVCPTGAIFDGRGSYMGREVQVEHIRSTCSQCSIGCGIEIATRGGNVVRVKGDWDAEVNKGLLCRKGRFERLYDGRKRVKSPLLRQGGRLQEVSWEEALKATAERLKDADAGGVGVLTSSNATNEALFMLSALLGEMKVTNIGLLNDASAGLSGIRRGALADIAKGDVILVVGADPVMNQPVASFLIKRAVDKGARLIVVDDADNDLACLATMKFGVPEVRKAVDVAARAENPVVIYGERVPPPAVGALEALRQRAVFIALEPGVNTQAAVAFGLKNGFKASAVKTLFVLFGEEQWDGKGVELGEIGKDAFVAVVSSYISPLTDRADVVLPMAIWSERSGTITNVEGRVQKVCAAVDPEGEAKPDWEIISLLARMLGKKIDESPDKMSDRAIEALKGGGIHRE
ncbi:MAG TPA: molybdopterin-dependent oxidoreductase [Syntrophales bacterium]|nr:molybdopterin-dependent oxidoreductase [Syntrophales bacterium]